MRTLSRTGVLVIVMAAAGCAGLRVGPRGIVQAYAALSDDEIRAAIALPAPEEKSVAVHRGLWDNFDGGWRSASPRRYESALSVSRGSDGALRILLSASCEEQDRDSGPVRTECRHKISRWNGHAFVAEKNELVYAKDIRADVKLSMEDVP